MAEAPLGVKPKLRGVFHELAFIAAVGVGVPLAITAEPGKARFAAIVFASCVAACFGASALYHRPTWEPRARSWLARLDHAGIYLLIAGTYTPFGLLVLSRNWATRDNSPLVSFRQYALISDRIGLAREIGQITQWKRQNHQTCST